MVVSVDEYALQQQRDNAARSQENTKLRSDDAIQAEIKAAEAVGMTVADYREQQKSYADLTRQAMENKLNHPDPPIEDEERLVVGSGGLGQKGELTDTIQALQVVSQGFSKEQIEEQRKALSQMKSWHEQRQQENDYYRVIEGGKESIVEDGYVQISPYTSSSEQDDERRGQPPNLSAVAEGMRVPHQSKPSPRDQHYMKEQGDGMSLPSYFNDGSHDHPPNHSPHSSRHRPLPPPADPHHQFTIGSMVCLDMQKGEPFYGILQWVGTVPDFTGTIAGVELVSDYETCAYLFNTINRSNH